MCSTAEMEKCPFEKACAECYPGLDRDRCTDENCDFCSFYWDFLVDGLIIDEK